MEGTNNIYNSVYNQKSVHTKREIFWTDLSKKKLEQYIGIKIMIGIIRRPQWDDHWKNHSWDDNCIVPPLKCIFLVAFLSKFYWKLYYSFLLYYARIFFSFKTEL